jgi:hypothetical protein
MKIQDKLFKSHENPTQLTIHIDNQKIIINISHSLSEIGRVFKLDFNYKGEYYEKQLILSKTTIAQHHYWCSNEILFDKIQLHEIDKSRIASCLNEILDDIIG